MRSEAADALYSTDAELVVFVIGTQSDGLFNLRASHVIVTVRAHPSPSLRSLHFTMSVDETAVGIRPPETILQGRKPGELYRGEIIWRDNQKWLQESGYALRPRYQPDWVPSWQGTSKDWSKCEDGLGAIVRTICILVSLKA